MAPNSEGASMMARWHLAVNSRQDVFHSLFIINIAAERLSEDDQNILVDWLIEWGLISRQHASGYMRPSKGHGEGLFVAPPPNAQLRR